MLYMDLDEVFKALADASRRSLLDRLHASNGQTLNELCDGLAMTRQAVTKHLAILEAANLVTTYLDMKPFGFLLWMRGTGLQSAGRPDPA